MTGHHSNSETRVRLRHLDQRLITAWLISHEQLDHIIIQILSTSPANGAPVVARACVDPTFRERLLTDSNASLTNSLCP